MDWQQKNTPTSVHVFVSYAHEDEALRDELVKHLSMLHRQQWITIWHDRQILPGADWAQTIDQHLEHSPVILLLISSNFLASNYCYSSQMKRALQRHHANQARVIPILLRPVDWKGAPFQSLEPLPTNALPITKWDNRDEAFANVAEGIRRALEDLSSLPTCIPHALLPAIWNIPYRQNPFFIGREDLLSRLRAQLQAHQTAALSQPQAISGLGGIGKTQVAIEYAYRYHQHYQAVLWAGAESRETLVSSYVALAKLLKLPEQDTQKQTITVQAVKTWLQTRSQWLLILDNADELTSVRDFIPPVFGGHIVLTTRASALGGLARRLEVETLPPEQGALLLLRRAEGLPSDCSLEQAESKDRVLALRITEQLGGLPLALDQAGAYLEETGCGLSKYDDIFQQRRSDLLKRRGQNTQYPASVATTWSLSFERIEQKNPAAAELLRLCAYLSPDSIPEKIFSEGASHLGPLLEPVTADAFLLDQAIETLKAYSLIRRNSTTGMLSIHRLVQVVLQDTMPVEMSKQWKERVVNAVNATFPGLEPSSWVACERWLPHAFICAVWIEQEQMMTPVASCLLAQAGLYLKERAQYPQAESFLQQRLTIDEQAYGQEHPEVATALNNLACLYWNQGKYRETEPLFVRALAIRQHHLGHEDPATAEILQNLACLYQTQGKNEEAKQLFQSAVVIDEHIAGPTVAIDLSNQADLYRRLGDYEEAESLLERALAVHKEHENHEILSIAHILHKQGLLAYEKGKLEEADAFFRCTLQMYEKWLGHEHPNTAQILNALADLSRIQGNYQEAESLFQRALAIKEKQFEKMHSSTAATLNSLALLYLRQGKWVYVKQEKCMKEGKFKEAESLFQRALRIRQQVLGENHPNTALILNNLACLYQSQEKVEEAEQLFQRALAVHEKRLGREHPSTIPILHNLIYFYGIQGKYEKAQSLLEQALAMNEKLSEQKYPRALFLHRDNLTLLEAIEWNAESTT